MRGPERFQMTSPPPHPLAKPPTHQGHNRPDTSLQCLREPWIQRIEQQAGQAFLPCGPSGLTSTTKPSWLTDSGKLHHSLQPTLTANKPCLAHKPRDLAQPLSQPSPQHYTTILRTHQPLLRQKDVVDSPAMIVIKHWESMRDFHLWQTGWLPPSPNSNLATMFGESVLLWTMLQPTLDSPWHRTYAWTQWLEHSNLPDGPSHQDRLTYNKSMSHSMWNSQHHQGGWSSSVPHSRINKSSQVPSVHSVLSPHPDPHSSSGILGLPQPSTGGQQSPALVSELCSIVSPIPLAQPNPAPLPSITTGESASTKIMYGAQTQPCPSLTLHALHPRWIPAPSFSPSKPTPPQHPVHAIIEKPMKRLANPAYVGALLSFSAIGIQHGIY